jgi:hypothetical protein
VSSSSSGKNLPALFDSPTTGKAVSYLKAAQHRRFRASLRSKIGS